uniref:cation:dicarboxylate symporter family transporter n=1 Tax=Staphylococcus warneri TaxID=1292 RepID=UPI0021B48B2E
MKRRSDWFSMVGDGYVGVLEMIVMWLIFICMVSGLSKIEIGDKFGKMGSYMLMFLIGSVGIAGLVGIGYGLVF